jgi:hypothetical protein
LSAHLTQGRGGERADERLVVAAQHAAEHDQPYGVVLAQLVENGKVAGDDGDRTATQAPGDQLRAGADVEHHHASVHHQPGGLLGHRLLLRPVMGGRDIERLLVGGRAHREGGAAVGADQLTITVEQRQVPPDRRLTDLEPLGQLTHRSDTRGPQGLDDPRVALARSHAVMLAVVALVRSFHDGINHISDRSSSL